MLIFDAFISKETHKDKYSFYVDSNTIGTNYGHYLEGIESGINKETDLSMFNDFSEEKITQEYNINGNTLFLFSDREAVGYAIKDSEGNILEANFAENKEELSSMTDLRSLGIATISNGSIENSEDLINKENSLLEEYDEFKNNAKSFAVTAISKEGLPENYDIVMSYDSATGMYSASITKDGKILETIDQASLIQEESFQQEVVNTVNEISDRTSSPVQVTDEEIKRKRIDYDYAMKDIIEDHMRDMDKYRANEEAEEKSKRLQKEYDTNKSEKHPAKCVKCEKDEEVYNGAIEIDDPEENKYNKPANVPQTKDSDKTQEKVSEANADMEQDNDFELVLCKNTCNK